MDDHSCTDPWHDTLADGFPSGFPSDRIVETYLHRAELDAA